MKCEWPVLTRCCFCLPLRRGLIAIGYVKFIFSAFMTGLYSFVVHKGSETTTLILHGAMDEVAVELCLVLYILELVSCGLMLYGAHMKVPYYLRICFYYGLISTLGIVLAEGVDMLNIAHQTVEMIGFCFTGIFIQLYLMTVLWNLLKKLEAQGCQHFENPLHHFISARA